MSLKAFCMSSSEMILCKQLPAAKFKLLKTVVWDRSPGSNYESLKASTLVCFHLVGAASFVSQ